MDSFTRILLRPSGSMIGRTVPEKNRAIAASSGESSSFDLVLIIRLPPCFWMINLRRREDETLSRQRQDIVASKVSKRAHPFHCFSKLPRYHWVAPLLILVLFEACRSRDVRLRLRVPRHVRAEKKRWEPRHKVEKPATLALDSVNKRCH